MEKMGQPTKGLAAKDGWVRASTPGAKNGAAYVTIMNHGMKSDALVVVVSSVSDKAELHSHKNVDGVMRMRKKWERELTGSTATERNIPEINAELRAINRKIKILRGHYILH